MFLLRLNLVLTYEIPPEFRGGVHSFILNRHTPSGQSEFIGSRNCVPMTFTAKIFINGYVFTVHVAMAEIVVQQSRLVSCCYRQALICFLDRRHTDSIYSIINTRTS